MNDIELERQMVEQNSPAHYPSSDDSDDEEELSPAEEHRQAQQSGEVFEGGYRGDGL